MTYIRAAALARCYLANLWKAADDAGDSTVADDRSKRVDDFAAALLVLWQRLQGDELSEDDYIDEVEAAWDRALGTVPDAAQAKLAQLKDKALARAERLRDPMSLDDDDEDAPSKAQRHGAANMVAGALWAATMVVKAYEDRAATMVVKAYEDMTGDEALDIYEWQANDDPAVCPDCDELDGQQFTLDEISFWPGESDFGAELPDGTQCGENCRCALTHVANERSNAPVQKG